MLHALEPLATSPAAYAFAVLLGLLWGSFANVCIYRWPPTEEFPDGRSVIKPGSHCFACKTPVRWYDNVPLLSWLWLRGACRACRAPFSGRYLIVEAVTGLLFGLAWFATVEVGTLFEPLDQRLVRFAVYAAFSFLMVVISFIDLDHKLILNKVTRPSVVIFYALGLLLGRTWYDGLIGVAVGYGLPWTIGEIYYRVTGREGLGLGDSMLLAVIGALLGWPGVAASLFGGSIVGSVIGIAVLLISAAPSRAAGRSGEAGPSESLARRSEAEPGDDAPAGDDEDGEDAPSLMRTELPFGPFLAIAAVFYMLAEPWIVLQFRFPGG